MLILFFTLLNVICFGVILKNKPQFKIKSAFISIFSTVIIFAFCFFIPWKYTMYILFPLFELILLGFAFYFFFVRKNKISKKIIISISVISLVSIFYFILQYKIKHLNWIDNWLFVDIYAKYAENNTFSDKSFHTLHSHGTDWFWFSIGKINSFVPVNSIRITSQVTLITFFILLTYFLFLEMKNKLMSILFWLCFLIFQIIHLIIYFATKNNSQNTNVYTTGLWTNVQTGSFMVPWLLYVYHSISKDQKWKLLGGCWMMLNVWISSTNILLTSIALFFICLFLYSKRKVNYEYILFSSLLSIPILFNFLFIGSTDTQISIFIYIFFIACNLFLFILSYFKKIILLQGLWRSIIRIIVTLSIISLLTYKTIYFKGVDTLWYQGMDWIGDIDSLFVSYVLSGLILICVWTLKIPKKYNLFILVLCLFVSALSIISVLIIELKLVNSLGSMSNTFLNISHRFMNVLMLPERSGGFLFIVVSPILITNIVSMIKNSTKFSNSSINNTSVNRTKNNL